MRSGRREWAVCDLCLERPRAAALGEASRRERVRSVGGAASVRRIWPAPGKRGEFLDVAANSSNRDYPRYPGALASTTGSEEN
jgi:hypothetical protein